MRELATLPTANPTSRSNVWCSRTSIAVYLFEYLQPSQSLSLQWRILVDRLSRKSTSHAIWAFMGFQCLLAYELWRFLSDLQVPHLSFQQAPQPEFGRRMALNVGQLLPKCSCKVRIALSKAWNTWLLWQYLHSSLCTDLSHPLLCKRCRRHERHSYVAFLSLLSEARPNTAFWSSWCRQDARSCLLLMQNTLLATS